MSIIPGRVKERWSADPQNTTWSRDKEKFGYKMLEKMGWAEGSGLGAKGNGVKTHLKATRKSNTLGIGAKNDYDYEWLKTRDMYNNLLADLNEELGTSGDKSETTEGSSEKKALPTGGRRSAMVYHRFRKSKDLNLYSTDDMSAILGDNQKRPSRHQSTSEAEETLATNTAIPSDGMTVTSKLNLSKYFAQRSKQSSAQQSDAEDSEDQRPAFGGALERFMSMGQAEEGKATRKHKHDSDDEDDDEGPRQSLKKKKEKSPSLEEDEEGSGLQVTVSKKSKKKKEKAQQEIEITAEEEEQPKKSKKSKKVKEDITPVVEEAERDDGKKQKKKKRAD